MTSAPVLNPLTKSSPIAAEGGAPSNDFMLKWQQLQKAVASVQPIVTDDDLSALLDLIGSTQGDILYRDADDWLALAPGTLDDVLTTGGPGANPSWKPGGGTPLTPSGSYPDDGSDTTAATPGYVASARAAAIAVIPALTHAAGYPSASDTTAATPAYVAAGLAGGGKPSLYDLTAGIPAIGGFTVFGDLTSTVTVSALKAINLKNSTSITGMAGHYIAAPGSTPYRVRILLQKFSLTAPTSGNSVMCAGWYDGSKFQFLYMRTTGDLYIAGYTDYHTLDTTMFHSGLSYIPDDIWFGLHNDGTNLNFEISRDGVNFYAVYSATITSYLANANNVFYSFIDNGGNPWSGTLRCLDPAGLSAAFP